MKKAWGHKFIIPSHGLGLDRIFRCYLNIYYLMIRLVTIRTFYIRRYQIVMKSMLVYFESWQKKAWVTSFPGIMSHGFYIGVTD